jgi:hypothetical protein
LEGKSIDNPPESLLIYEICKTFSCLPSQLDEEDSKTISEFITIMNAVGEHEKKGDKKAKREALAKKHGGVKR